MTKTIVAFDCDGVTANLQDAVIKWHNHNYGTKHNIHQLTDFLFRNLWGCDQKEELRKLDEFYNSEHFHNVSPIEGAVESIDLIRLLGENYYAMTLTARPENLKQKTQEWLAKYFPNRFEKVIFSTPYGSGKSMHEDKADICVQERVRYIVEDTTRNAVACHQRGISSIVLNQPWNVRDELPKGVMRAREWKEVVELISKG